MHPYLQLFDSLSDIITVLKVMVFVPLKQKLCAAQENILLILEMFPVSGFQVCCGYQSNFFWKQLKVLKSFP